MSDSKPYAEPLVVTDVRDCGFYHTMEIPGHGLVEGQWDLRAGVERYLGGVSLAGKRVLDVGSNAGYDPFMFHTLGATDILACEPFVFIEQARFLEEIYGSGVDFQPLKWEDLDPGKQGRFDLVHCHGVLYHELHPMAMLERLRDMLADDGTLLFGSMMLGDPELSEYARFVPGAYYGDPTWWWVPGRLCMRWMLETAGLEVTAEFGLHDGPPGEFPVVNGYFEARRAPA